MPEFTNNEFAIGTTDNSLFDEAYAKLRHFLKTKYKLSDEDISLDSLIEGDLGFYGDDIGEIFTDLAREFCIDVSQLYEKYEFNPEFLDIVALVKRWKKPSGNLPKQKDISVRAIVQAILNGKM